MNLLDITYYIIYILNLNRLDFNKNQYFFYMYSLLFIYLSTITNSMKKFSNLKKYFYNVNNIIEYNIFILS